MSIFNKGHILDLEESIHQILRLYPTLGGKLKKNIYFKISVDGREVNKIKQVAIVPLNLRDKFPSQSVDSVFYIGLFQMTESKDNIEKTIGVIQESIKNVEKRLYFNESTVKIIYVSDMHNVGFTFDYQVFVLIVWLNQWNNMKLLNVNKLLEFYHSNQKTLLCVFFILSNVRLKTL